MKHKNFLLFGLLGFVSVLLFSLKSNNVFAIYTADYGVRVANWTENNCTSLSYSENHLYNQWFSGCGVTTIVPVSSSVSATGDTLVYSGKLNIVKQLIDVNGSSTNYWLDDIHVGVRSISFAGVDLVLQQPATINYWITDWWDNINGVDVHLSTLTIQWSFIASGNINGLNGAIRISLFNENAESFFDLFGSSNDLNYYYFEPTDYDLQVVFTDNASSYYNQMINQNQMIISQNQDMLDFLKDDSSPSVDTSVLSGASGWLPPGPVDSVLTLPITLAQNVVNIFTGQNQCRPIVLPFDFLGAGTSLSIPCLSSYLNQAGANVIWNTVGLVISAFMYYYTLRWLYKFIDDTLTLRENSGTMWGGL